MKKWPMWAGEQVVGMLDRHHFACAVQYPGDDKFYLTPRRMPPRKVLKKMLKHMQDHQIESLEFGEETKRLIDAARKK